MSDLSDLIGCEFEYGGRGPKYDCYGLIMECAKRDGVTLPDFGFANNQSLISAMMGATLPQWEEIKPTRGAVVLFRIGRYVSHVGYMLDENKMIHTWNESGGVTIERIDAWKQRIIGFYKYVGI